MVSELLKSGVPTAHRNARQRVQSKVDLPRLFQAIDADPAIVGAGVVYIESDLTVVTLREFQAVCSIAPKKIVLREAPRCMAPLEFVRELETQPRESRLMAEALGTGLACTSAVLGWMVVIGGGGLAPFSGGASLVVSGVAASAAVASTLQCSVGILRIQNELRDPSRNDEMDRQDWYRYMMPLLDAISLLGAGVSTLTTFKLLKIRKAATGMNWYELSRGLSRQQRKALTRELLSIKHPDLSLKQLKLKQRLGELPKSYTADRVRQATFVQIKDSIGAVSSFSGVIQSGYLKAIAVGLLYEPED